MLIEEQLFTPPYLQIHSLLYLNVILYLKKVVMLFYQKNRPIYGLGFIYKVE